jgi:UDP-glucose 4-epimerase
MSEENIVVTGGGGFIGSHLTEMLLSSGSKVIVFDNIPLCQSRNLEHVKNHKNLTFVQGDIRDKEALKMAITEDVHKIFHLCAVVGVKKYCADPLGVIDINVGGTRNMLELAQKHNIKVIFTSTSEIYGKNPRVPWAEDADRVLGSTSIERWSYSTSKAVCEHMILGMHKSVGLPATIVRYFNVYGPRQEPYYMISQSIYKVLRNEQPLLYDKGNQTRCFTFVEDAIQGTIAAANSQKANGHVFNIGSDKETTIRDAIELIIKISGKKIMWKDLDTRQHYGKKYEDVPRRVPDISKAKQLLGWEPKIPFELGLKKTIKWCVENSWWWKPLVKND